MSRSETKEGTGMTGEPQEKHRYFTSYSGVRLPLHLVNEIEATGLANRNTFFRGLYDAQDRLVEVEKMVYGEVEMSHRYAYHANGALALAEITNVDGETNALRFDEAGQPAGED